MKAIEVSSYGDPSALAYKEVPDPTIQPEQLLVRVLAAGVNYIDTYQRSGSYPMALPFIPGLDGSGEVIAVGSDVAGIAPGDLVAWPSTPSSYAELSAVPAHRAVKIPSGMDPEIAAASMLQGMTAHYLVHDTFKIAPGSTALVHAAAGGVGLLLTQLIHSRGGEVIATASTPEKSAIALAAGADQVIPYEGFAKRVREITNGRGVDVVYDGVGKATFDESLEALARRGLMVLYGAASGGVPDFNLQRLNALGSLYITRPTLADYVASDAELNMRAGELFDLMQNGTLNFKIGGRYRLEEAAQAHTDLEGRKTSGKLLLIP